MNSLTHSIKIEHAGDLYEFDLRGREIVLITIHPNMQSYFASPITLDQTPDSVLTKFYAKLSNHHTPRDSSNPRRHATETHDCS